MNSEQQKYYEDLRKRQAKHLQNVKGQNDSNWRPCMHEQCGSCCGTGIQANGSPCIHMISCPCPKCTPYY